MACAFDYIVWDIGGERDAYQQKGRDDRQGRQEAGSDRRASRRLLMARLWSVAVAYCLARSSLRVWTADTGTAWAWSGALVLDQAKGIAEKVIVPGDVTEPGFPD